MSYNNLLHAPDSSKFIGILFVYSQETINQQLQKKSNYLLLGAISNSQNSAVTKMKVTPSYSYAINRYYKASTAESSKLHKLESKLSQLRKLGSNWDGYDSPKPNLHAFANARTIIDIAHKLNNFPTSITPSVEGGIGLTFEGISKYAVVECFNDGEIVAIGSNRNGETKSWTLAGSDSELQQTIEEIYTYVGK